MNILLAKSAEIFSKYWSKVDHYIALQQMLDALNNLLVFGNTLRNSLILCLTESGAKLLPVCTAYPEKIVFYRKCWYLFLWESIPQKICFLFKSSFFSNSDDSWSPLLDLLTLVSQRQHTFCEMYRT